MSSSFTAGPRGRPKGHLSPRAGTLNQSVINQGSWGFYTLRGRIHQGKLLFSPVVIGVVEVKNNFLTVRWVIIFLGSGEISTMSRGAALVTGWLIEPQPTGNHSVGSRFPHTAGGTEPGDLRLPPRFIRVVDMWTAFLTRGWERILPVNGGTSTLARAATLAARWLHEPQSMSNHSVGLRFPTLDGVVSTRGICVYLPDWLEV